jgi:maltooligosyltrehalose trehalohydrolase
MTAGGRHGAQVLADGTTEFSVWAPAIDEVALVVEGGGEHLLKSGESGYHRAVLVAPPGTRYRYLLDGKGPFADPASRWQPDGVHGPSCVVGDLRTAGGDPFRGLPLAQQVICELHVGTFTEAGTFEEAASQLGQLALAGYTAVELMPVAEFPGGRNWGYDGVFPFAAQSSYGGPHGLAAFVRAAHDEGLAVILDVVFNHLGPEGAVLGEFGPYFTDAYRTPWGSPLNFSGHGSDGVRSFFSECALFWTRDLGVDGLRLDAVHAIFDPTASPFVGELVAIVRAEGIRLGRTVTLVAESTDNDPRLVRPAEAGGLDLDGQWDDDFHHSLRVALTGDRTRWFADYSGLGDLACAFEDGFVLDGRFSGFRGRRHGASSRGLRGDRLVVFAQNHDQIGNGGRGARLSTELPFEAQWPIAAAVLLSPFVPLRFMGEEYGDPAPFPYFTSHSDAALAEAVRRGRKAELGPGAELPDPQAVSTFESARPDRSLAESGAHRDLLAWQQLLLRMRGEHPALGSLEPGCTSCETHESHNTLVVLRHAHTGLGAPAVAVVLQLGPEPGVLDSPVLSGASFQLLLAHRCTRPDGGSLGLEGWAVAVLSEAIS